MGQQQPSPSPPPSSKFRQMGPTGATVPVRRFSRQNTIQVVSDVQGVLSDILRDIVPSSSKTSGGGGRSASSKPLIAAKAAVPSPVSVDYGNKSSALLT